MPCPTSRLAVVLFLLPLALAGAARAEDWASSSVDPWTVRVLGQRLTTSATVVADLQDSWGAYAGVERRLSDRWGVELGIGQVQMDGTTVDSFDIFGLRIESRVESEVTWLPVSLAANLHLTPGARFDLYAGGRVGWAFFDDVEVISSVHFDGLPVPLPPLESPPVRFQIDADDAFFWGLRMGLDYPLGDQGWGITAAMDVTFLELTIEPSVLPADGSVESRTSVDLDPVSWGFGVFKRW